MVQFSFHCPHRLPAWSVPCHPSDSRPGRFCLQNWSSGRSRLCTKNRYKYGAQIVRKIQICMMALMRVTLGGKLVSSIGGSSASSDPLAPRLVWGFVVLRHYGSFVDLKQKSCRFIDIQLPSLREKHLGSCESPTRFTFFFRIILHSICIGSSTLNIPQPRDAMTKPWSCRASMSNMTKSLKCPTSMIGCGALWGLSVYDLGLCVLDRLSLPEVLTGVKYFIWHGSSLKSCYPSQIPTRFPSSTRRQLWSIQLVKVRLVMELYETCLQTAGKHRASIFLARMNNSPDLDGPHRAVATKASAWDHLQISEAETGRFLQHMDKARNSITKPKYANRLMSDSTYFFHPVPICIQQ